MEIKCYKNVLLQSSYAEGLWETDDLFSGIIITENSEKVAIRYPFRFYVYSSSNVVFVSSTGRSYRLDPDVVVEYDTHEKIAAYIRACMATDYYQEFVATSDEIELGYDLSEASNWTKESINNSIDVVMQGGILAYHDPAAFVSGENNKYHIVGNKLKFRLNQNGRLIRVRILNRFMYA